MYKETNKKLSLLMLLSCVSDKAMWERSMCERKKKKLPKINP